VFDESLRGLPVNRWSRDFRIVVLDDFVAKNFGITISSVNSFSKANAQSCRLRSITWSWHVCRNVPAIVHPARDKL